MGLVESLPGTPLKKTTVTQLEQAENITTALPVLSIDNGPSVMDDLAIVLYLATETTQFLLGFTRDGWDVIEQVATDDQFDHNDETAAEWVLDRGAFEWYVENGGNPDADIFGEITNKESAPAFMQPDFD